MKHIDFISFGRWTPLLQSQTRLVSDALLQSIELAVAAERHVGPGLGWQEGATRISNANIP